MITSSGKVLQYHGKKLCVKCNRITAHTCFYIRYRKSEKNDDGCEKTERWVCDICHTLTTSQLREERQQRRT